MRAFHRKARSAIVSALKVPRREWAAAPAAARAAWATLLVCLLVLSGSSSILAQGASVPPQLQAELLSKLSAYDRNFVSRAGEVAKVVLLVKPDDAESSTSAAALKLSLSHLERLGGLPHRETVVRYQDAASLAKLCR